MLKAIAPFSTKYFSSAIIMPNTVPPTILKEEVLNYKSKILKASTDENFIPLMTSYFKNFTFSELKDLKEHIIGIKLYPKGVTTNSESGVDSIKNSFDTFKAMEELNIPLLVHGETTGFVLDRELEFLKIYDSIAKNFPNLKITMEHITTKEAANFLDVHKNIYATITVHHLYLDLNDLLGNLLEPSIFCKPVLKRPEDKKALMNLALNAHPKVMFGSDSAPHPKEKKECLGCAAGVFTAPIAIPLLANLFDKFNKLKNLRLFLSENAKNIYNLDLPKKTIVCKKTPLKIKDSYNGVTPMMRGEVINWSVEI